jgi:hypothetical protein
MSKPFRRGLFNRVGLIAGTPVPPADASPALLRERVQGLMAG